MNARNALAYQSAAAEGATHIGMLVLVYDALVKDFIKAAAAVRREDIEARCSASSHALLLLGHLDSWVELIDDPILASSLTDFYGILRGELLRLQAEPEAASFENLAQRISETKTSWQAKESSKQKFQKLVIQDHALSGEQAAHVTAINCHA